MKCVKLNLQERSKVKSTKLNPEKPRRFCQKRMVDPEHEEDPRWTEAINRFHCTDFQNYDLNETSGSGTDQSYENLVLSVQNLQFHGNVEQNRKLRSSFKYKTSDSQKHRMFVKQIVDEFKQNNVARSSELSDYFDDYTKYISNNDQSRPSSGKSSIVLFCLNSKCKENKCVQVDLRRDHDLRKKPKIEKNKRNPKKHAKSTLMFRNIQDNVNAEKTKIAFHKNGKRKSLTISRAESPATVQVIRVDVVCNYSCTSSLSDYEKNDKQSCRNGTNLDNKENQISIPFQKTGLAKKYRLTNTVKTLDENVSGSKVTLMCKTFKLSDRQKTLSDKNQKLQSPLSVSYLY